MLGMELSLIFLSERSLSLEINVSCEIYMQSILVFPIKRCLIGSYFIGCRDSMALSPE
jgi:hypothetical protein